jgi:hypothetical protein
MAITTADYASLYMATEVPYNKGDAEPFLDLFADEFVFNGNVIGRADFNAVVRNNVANGMQFRTVGLIAYGPFLIDYGTLHMPDGSESLLVGVLRFNEQGKVIEFNQGSPAPA